MMTAEQFTHNGFSANDIAKRWVHSLAGELAAEIVAFSDAHAAAQLAEKEREIDRLQSWLAEADQGFGGFFSTLAAIEKAAKAGDTATILSVAKYCRESEKKWDLGKFDAKLKVAEQRLQDAQARIKYLENVKVRAGGERS